MCIPHLGIRTDGRSFFGVLREYRQQHCNPVFLFRFRLFFQQHRVLKRLRQA